jgi:signal transduction histidine kinase
VLHEGAPALAAAASADGVTARPPTATEFEAAARLPGARALHGPDSTAALRGLANRHALAAAAPVLDESGRALAVLATGGREAARPRALAALAAAARRLVLPLVAAKAEHRFARIDADVRQLDRLALLGRLVQELAHEVRNPLVSVKTFLQLLPERRDDPEFTTRFLSVVTGELERIERLLELVIDHPRPAAADTETAELAPVIATVLELLRPYARQHGIALEADTGSEPAEVTIGEDALRQVLLNLVLNAIDATPRGERVKVSVHARAGARELVVADAGPGIPAELRERVFEPFFSTRGTHHGGIGLAIARGLVELAGGSISVRSSAGGGAELVVVVPCTAPA